MLESELLSALVADIYDAALDPALWPRALEGTRDFVRGCAANFYWQDVSTESAGVFHCAGIDPAYLQSYFERYAKMNSLYPAAAFIEPSKVFNTFDVVPRSEFVQTRFYHEWMLPQGMVDTVATNLEKSVTSVAALAVIRGKRDGLVDDEARRRMRLIVPHMLRAASIGHLIGKHQMEKAALADTLGRIAAAVFLVDATGCIAFANEPGQAMLAKGKLLRDGRGRLAAVEPQANRTLQDAFAAAGRGDPTFEVRGVAISLTPAQDERWLAHVLPLTSGARQQAGAAHSAAAAVFVRKAALDIPSPLETLTRLYKLTGSEVRVLQAVVETGGVPEIAVALGVSESTVRTHLKNLFDKTGTHRQADLVKLVATHASPFHA
jgi:DNA-binding CsgD family transcriptional regulator